MTEKKNSPRTRTCKAPHSSWGTPKGRAALRLVRPKMAHAIAKECGKRSGYCDDCVAWAENELCSKPVPETTEQLCAKAVVLAQREARNVLRSEQRRRVLGEKQADAVYQSTVGGQARRETTEKRYAKHEEKALKDAVLEYCEEKYRKRWGKDWNPARYWPTAWPASGARTYREFWRALEAESLQFEKGAAEIADELRVALCRAAVFVQQTPKLDERESYILSSMRQMETVDHAAAGGNDTNALCVSRKLIEELRYLLERQWVVAPQRDELWRFVARAFTPHGAVFLGCRNPLDVDELTVMWLLAGGWPAVRKWPAKGITVVNLVNRRMRPTVDNAYNEVLREEAYQAMLSRDRNALGKRPRKVVLERDYQAAISRKKRRNKTVK